jgi:hypothetical protein
LSQMNPVHIVVPCFLNISLHSVLPSAPRSPKLSPSSIAFIVCPMRAASRRNNTWWRAQIMQFIMYVHIHTYMHAYIHTHTHTHTYMHTYIHTYTQAYIHTYIYIHTHIYIYTYTYTHTHTHIYIHIHTYLHTSSPQHAHVFLRTRRCASHSEWETRFHHSLAVPC